jgi:hypothetical protein
VRESPIDTLYQLLANSLAAIHQSKEGINFRLILDSLNFLQVHGTVGEVPNKPLVVDSETKVREL